MCRNWCLYNIVSSQISITFDDFVSKIEVKKVLSFFLICHVILKETFSIIIAHQLFLIYYEYLIVYAFFVCITALFLFYFVNVSTPFNAPTVDQSTWNTQEVRDFWQSVKYSTSSLEGQEINDFI